MEVSTILAGGAVVILTLRALGDMMARRRVADDIRAVRDEITAIKYPPAPDNYLCHETARRIQEHAGASQCRFLLAAFSRALTAEGYRLTRNAAEQEIIHTEKLKVLAERMAEEKNNAQPYAEHHPDGQITEPFYAAGPIGQIVWLINASAADGWYISTAAEKSASLQI